MGQVSSSNNNKRAKAAEPLPPPKKQDSKSHCSKELIGKIMAIAGVILLAAGLSTIIASSITGVNYFAAAAKFIGTTPTIFSIIVWSVSGTVTVIGIALVYCKKPKLSQATTSKAQVKAAAASTTSKQVNGNANRKALTVTTTTSQPPSANAGQTKAKISQPGNASPAALGTPPPLSPLPPAGGADDDAGNGFGTWDDEAEALGNGSAVASHSAGATHSDAKDQWGDNDLSLDVSNDAGAAKSSGAAHSDEADEADPYAGDEFDPPVDDAHASNTAANAAAGAKEVNSSLDQFSMVSMPTVDGSSQPPAPPAAAAKTKLTAPQPASTSGASTTAAAPLSSALGGPNAVPPPINTANSSPGTSIDAVPVVSGAASAATSGPASANSSLGAPIPAGHLNMPPPPPAAKAKASAVPPPRSTVDTPIPPRRSTAQPSRTGSVDDSGTVAAVVNPKPQQTGDRPSPVTDPSFFVRPGAQKANQIQASYADMAADLERIKQLAAANAASGAAAPTSPVGAKLKQLAPQLTAIARGSGSSPNASATDVPPAASNRLRLTPLRSKHRPAGDPPPTHGPWRRGAVPRASIGRGDSGNTLGFESRPLVNAGDASNAAAAPLQPTIEETGTPAAATASGSPPPVNRSYTIYAKKHNTRPTEAPMQGFEWKQSANGKWEHVLIEDNDSASPSQAQQPVQQTPVSAAAAAGAASSVNAPSGSAAPNAYDTIQLPPPSTPPQDGYQWTWAPEHGQYRQVPLPAEVSTPSSAAASAPQTVALASGNAFIIQMPPEDGSST